MSMLADIQPVVMLKLNDVCQRVALSPATIYRRLEKSEFPAPVDMGGGSVRWYEHEIQEYLLNRPRARLAIQPKENGGK
ncbi:helix-turn-helix transcriptional regulator [Roseibium alexandrii]|uniref:helix-turn-helix transcriptional regulator n=1 Tax=Roseibium alexandrii TaxID=388408 RepID=UPI00375315E3